MTGRNSGAMNDRDGCGEDAPGKQPPAPTRNGRGHGVPQR